MNLEGIRKLLQNNNVRFDPSHEKNTIDLALELGLIGLKLVCREESGVYDPEDVPVMRREGFLLYPGAFCVEVFEAVLISELEE